MFEQADMLKTFGGGSNGYKTIQHILKKGEIKNHQFYHFEPPCLKYTSVISEVRKKLRLIGFDLVDNISKKTGNEHTYIIERLGRHDSE
jgi:hypothetical protein